MEAKFGDFSEMANLLSVKSRVSSDITVLFERFSLVRLLSRMGMRKEQGYSLLKFRRGCCITIYISQVDAPPESVVSNESHRLGNCYG